jgi:hypothetical protein
LRFARHCDGRLRNRLELAVVDEIGIDVDCRRRIEDLQQQQNFAVGGERESDAAPFAVVVEQGFEVFATAGLTPHGSPLVAECAGKFRAPLLRCARREVLPRRRLHVAVQMKLLGEPAEILLAAARVVELEEHQPGCRHRSWHVADVVVQHSDRALGTAERNVDARFLGGVQELRHCEGARTVVGNARAERPSRVAPAASCEADAAASSEAAAGATREAAGAIPAAAFCNARSNAPNACHRVVRRDRRGGRRGPSVDRVTLLPSPPEHAAHEQHRQPDDRRQQRPVLIRPPRRSDNGGAAFAASSVARCASSFARTSSCIRSTIAVSSTMRWRSTTVSASIALASSCCARACSASDALARRTPPPIGAALDTVEPRLVRRHARRRLAGLGRRAGLRRRLSRGSRRCGGDARRGTRRGALGCARASWRHCGRGLWV